MHETPVLQNETAEKARSANAFDFLRLLFACLVIFSHVPAQLYGPQAAKREWLMRLTGGSLTMGGLAVDGFFLISGYLIVQSHMRCRGSKPYLLRRVARIYPAFIAAMLFSTWVVGWWGAVNRSGYLSLHHTAWFIIFTPALKAYSPRVFEGFHYANVNGSTWTIQYEFLCYLLVIPAAALGLFRKPALLTAVTAVLALLQLPGLPLHSLPTHWGTGSPLLNIISGPYAMPRFFLYFLTGACFLTFKSKLRPTPLLLGAAAAGLLLYILFPALQPLLLPPCLGILLFSFAFYAPAAFRSAAKHGDFSYGIYLYAWPVSMAVMLAAHRNISTALLAALTLIGSFCLAAISWHCLESPILQWAHQRTRT